MRSARPKRKGWGSHAHLVGVPTRWRGRTDSRDLLHRSLGAVDEALFDAIMGGNRAVLRPAGRLSAVSVAGSLEISAKLMRFRFNERKAAQAAAYLLQRKGGTLDKLVLLKTLYMADRRTLLEEGKPITGDRMVAMDHGPVLSVVLNLMNRTPGPGSMWAKLIEPPDADDDVRLKRGAKPDTDELSRYELRVLDDVLDKYSDMEPFDLVKLLHEICPEWRLPNGAVQDIDYVDLLRRNGKSESEIEDIEVEANLAYAHAMLGQ